jgi:ubiquinone/menaquinone biosynthesis C-methylase UbiE
MSSKPSKNHYRGLIAQWYDKILEKERKDIEFYREIVRHNKGKALELACGTGRILVPIRALGIDIEGLDMSPDMLALCSEKLKENNLSAPLYEQDMMAFNTGKHYSTIFISGGSFQLIDDIEKAITCLKTIHSHLQPGGLFITDLFQPWEQIIANTEGQWQLGRTASNDKGEEFRCHERTEYDFLNQLIKLQFKYELRKNEHQVDSMIDSFILRWYGKEEFRLMLEKAGFSHVEIKKGNIMSTHGESIVYFAYKD